MSDAQTIREHLKAQESILEEMAAAIRYDVWKPGIGVVHKVAALREHAVGAIELLDNSERMRIRTGNGNAIGDVVTVTLSGAVVRLVLDPAPRGDADA